MQPIIRPIQIQPAPIYIPPAQTQYPASIACSANYADAFGNSQVLYEELRARQCPNQNATQSICAGLLGQYSPVFSDPNNVNAQCRFFQ